MSILSPKPMLVLLSLACLPFMSNAENSGSATTSAASPKATIEWYCSPSNNSNFRGHVVGHTVVGNGGSYFQVEKYKIQRFNGQSGGSKANLNIYMGHNSDFHFTGHSPDALKQDGQWHNLNLRVNYPGRASAVKFKFIFDKSGSDPSCESVRPA